MASPLANTQHPQYSNGAFGITRRKRKKANALKGTNNTAGRTKGVNCQATPEQKGMARHGRAYRSHPQEYAAFCKAKQG